MQNYPFIHSADLTNPADNLELLCAHDHPAQEVEWLWPGKIPIGKVSMIIGDPGTGKTLLALDIAARASRGDDNWPDEPVESRERRVESQTSPAGSRLSTLDSRLPASTLILSATDDFQDTLRPRLDAAGADPRRIFYIPSITDLRHDIAQLRAAVERAPNVRLIIIDPINAFVGPTDSHFHSVLRRVLEPLAKLAAEKRIAVVAIAHLRKNDGAAIHRAAGSMGFVAAARSVWTLSRDAENPGRVLFLPVKNNLTDTARGLAFTLQSTDVEGAPTLEWDPTPIDVDPLESLRGREAADLNAARKWLRNALANGPRSAYDIEKEGEQYGFHVRTLRRALHAIGGQTQKRVDDIFDEWWWSIPDTDAREIVTTPSTTSAPGSAGGPSRDAVPPSPTPGRAGGCAPQPILNASDQFDTPRDHTRSSLLDPRSSQTAPTNPVPLCPLPENNDVPPPPPRVVSGSPDRRFAVANPAPKTTEGLQPPTANRPPVDPQTFRQSTRIIDRLDRQRRQARRGKRLTAAQRQQLIFTNMMLKELIAKLEKESGITANSPPPPAAPAPHNEIPLANQVTTATSDDLPISENLLWPDSAPPKMEMPSADKRLAATRRKAQRPQRSANHAVHQ